MQEMFEYDGYSLPVELVDKTGGGVDTFEAISSWHINLLQRHIGIKADDSVVEIGCGIGRDAIPLTKLISENGSYLGTDVIKPSIDWCNKNIASRFANFRFEWHDIFDDLHNPEGRLKAEDISLPVPSASVDLIILQSVFTHMFEHEIIHYLKEFKRILKPTGKIWASVFIVDEEILSHVRVHAPTRYALSFQHAYGDGCYINNIDSARGAVAFTQKAFDRMINSASLSPVSSPLKGSWSGLVPDPDFGQDVLLLKS